MSWEVLDHTADVGLRIEAESLEAALADLVVGFGRLLCPEGPIEAHMGETLTVEADQLDHLVIDCLDEVNFLHQMEGFLPASCRVELQEDPLRAIFHMRGETYDPDRHGYLMEIKATTYHEMVVDRSPARIEVIFDI